MTLKMSASKLETMLACPASAVLPWIETTTQFAEDGTAKHDYCANPTPEQLELARPEIRDECVALHEGIASTIHGMKAEAAYVVDVETFAVRFIGYNQHRRYGQLSSSEIGVTVDFVHPRGAFLELKTGHDDVTALEQNPQCWLEAFAFASHGKHSQVDAVLWHKKPDKKPFIQAATWTLFDLLDKLEIIREGRRAALAELSKYLAGQPLGYRPGDKQCQYCAAYLNCGAQMSLVKDALAIQGEYELNAENAWRAADQVALVESWVKKAKSQMVEFALRSPIVWPDGTTFGPHTKTEKSVDANKLWAVLEPYGLDVAKVGVEFEASQASIKRAAAVVAKQRGVTQASVQREMFDKLRELGGLEETTKSKIEKYTPQPGA